MANVAEIYHLGEDPKTFLDLQRLADRGAVISLNGDGPTLTVSRHVPDKEAFRTKRGKA